MAWTTPRTWTALETISASMLNVHLRNEFNFLGGLKRGGAALSSFADASDLFPYTLECIATHTTSVSLANVTNPNTSIAWTTLPFDTDAYDPHGFHDPVTNNSRFVVPSGKGGTYMILFSSLISTTANDTTHGISYCMCEIYDSSNVLKYEKQKANISCEHGTTSFLNKGKLDNRLIYELEDGDWIQFKAWQRNLGSLSMSAFYSASNGLGGLFKLRS